MIIDGKQIAEEIISGLKKEVEDKKLKLQLGAVLVGDDPEFKKFVELKGKAADKIGIDFTLYKFPKDIKTAELSKNIGDIVRWSDGVLIELPLPKHIDQGKILNIVPIEKDVDVLSDGAQRRFYDVEPRSEVRHRVLPPAVEGVKIIFDKFKTASKLATDNFHAFYGGLVHLF